MDTEGALYKRVSTEDQKSNTSPETQEKAGKAYFDSIDMPYKVFDDCGISAKKVKNRPAFIEMDTLAEQGKLSVIWCYHDYRLFRNASEATLYRTKWEKLGIKVVCLGTEKKFDTAINRFSTKAIDLTGELELETIKERLRGGITARRNNGEYAYGSIYGYRKEYSIDGKRHWKIVEKEAEIVKRVILGFCDNKSLIGICKELSDLGFTSPNGKPLSIYKFYNWIRQPAYFGLIEDDNGNIIDSKTYTGIVPKALWTIAEEKAKMLSINNPSKPRAKGYNSKWANSGLIRCSVCNSLYLRAKVPNSEMSEYRHKIGGSATCHSKSTVVAWLFDNLIEYILIKSIEPEKLYYGYVKAEKENSERLANYSDKLNHLKEKKKGEETKLSKSIKLLLSEDDPTIEAEIQIQKIEIANNLKTINKEIEQLLKATSEDLFGKYKSLIKEAFEIRNNWIDFDNKLRKQLLKQYLPSILITGNDLEITNFLGEQWIINVEHTRKQSWIIRKEKGRDYHSTPSTDEFPFLIEEFIRRYGKTLNQYVMPAEFNEDDPVWNMFDKKLDEFIDRYGEGAD